MEPGQLGNGVLDRLTSELLASLRKPHLWRLCLRVDDLLALGIHYTGLA